MVAAPAEANSRVISRALVAVSHVAHACLAASVLQTQMKFSDRLSEDVIRSLISSETTTTFSEAEWEKVSAVLAGSRDRAAAIIKRRDGTLLAVSA
jgi:hypothetical protein